MSQQKSIGTLSELGAAARSYSTLHAHLAGSSIPCLDGIRAFAVFFVIFYHLGMERGLPIFPGQLGVLAFFVLSGFLITWLLIKEDETRGRVSLKGFYRRRALRIFPAFYAYWIIENIARYARGGKVPWFQAMASFFYVSNYLHGIFRPMPSYMMHTWSLAVEEQFYMLWPLVFLAFGKTRRALIVGLAVFIPLVWLHRVDIWMRVHAGSYISYAFDTRVDGILVGCLLALILKERIARNVIGRICQPAWGPVVTCGLIACSVLAGQGRSAAHEMFHATCGLAVEPFLVAILLCQLITHSDDRAWNWLNSPPAVYLGRISYALYLYHGLAAGIAIRIAGPSKTLCVVGTLSLAILLASGSYYFIEKPFLALKNKQAAKRGKIVQTDQLEMPARAAAA